MALVAVVAAPLIGRSIWFPLNVTAVAYTITLGWWVSRYEKVPVRRD